MISSATGALVQVLYLSRQSFSIFLKFHDLISVGQTVGASIIACQRSNRHLIALEPDEEIFEALLKPYDVAIPEPEELEDSTTDSDTEEEVAPTKKKSRRIYCGMCHLCVPISQTFDVFIGFLILTLFSCLEVKVSHTN